MRMPLISRGREFVVERLESGDARPIAAIHGEDFLRPWSEAEFAALLEQDAVFGFVAREVGRPAGEAAGFVLARLAAGEAEILTIAVRRACRGAGLGRQLMEAVLRKLHAERAEALFLEVDETNRAALALYRRLGFRQVGERPAYYERAGAARTAALVMRRDRLAGAAAQEHAAKRTG